MYIHQHCFLAKVTIQLFCFATLLEILPSLNAAEEIGLFAKMQIDPDGKYRTMYFKHWAFNLL